MADSELRSSFKIVGGFARENPVPTTLYPARWKAGTTARPRRPVAPVMRAVLGIVVVLRRWVRGCGDGVGDLGKMAV